MSVFEQFRSQLPVVVNLTVKRQPYRLVFIRHRLSTRIGQINNRQSAMPQGNGPAGQPFDSPTVGSAHRKRVNHLVECGRIDCSTLFTLANDPAHD